ncbi:MAG: signal recognition particle-docking protein FtsY [Candidatus Parvarchaeota archaeon]|jgi:fused signal recognition particle receptor|nr:signal recognition particle-docking protein FtsY [Candidatus Parvarchaeota archaeon]MCL5420740.1 signal recognition particle-docking protein FtsY [Candidatus Parvarchaeota archaeon]
MFDFIKKKIKDSIDSIQKKLSKEEKQEISEDITREENIIKEDLNEIKKDIPKEEKKELKEEIREIKKEVGELDKNNRILEKKGGGETARKGLFSHLITDKDIDLIFFEIKSALMENNVALSVLDRIHSDLSGKLAGQSVSALNNKTKIKKAIKDSIADVLIGYSVEDFISRVKSKKPFIILIIGVNGAGKTTTIAKLCRFFLDNGLKPVIAAADTFRAASIEQLEIHAKRLNVEVIKHTYGADPAAVAFDAIKHAASDKDDVVLIDTAGRSDINKNLIEELKKVKKVSKPDLTIFIGDSLTGNDVVKQAEVFDKEIGIDMNILSKADVDKKGGAVLSISYVTKKPILFLGTGQDYKDLIPFNKEKTAEFILSD